ncbi:MAG: hypothetical protein LBE59_01855 [Nevskiaceae bacterium]|jgi:hypothetical protein|nr:hypothetical protein [Nevskiaceae bacterium]
MRELTYLFEFDSVRNSPREIATAHKELYAETVLRGNTVVFAFNQLADSLALTSLLQDEKWYEVFIELFSSGLLKISRYREFRTATQYILDGIEDCLESAGKCFYFSALPMLSTDTGRLTDLRDALIYSDPNLLLERAQERQDERAAYEFLHRYTQLILAVSQSEISYNPRNTGEFNKFSDFMNIAIGHLDDTGRAEVAGVLRGCNVGENRSVWLKTLGHLQLAPEVLMVCEGVVHLCYNYTVENSIHGIAKKYAALGDERFLQDFDSRLAAWIAGRESGLHASHVIENPDVALQHQAQPQRSMINWRSALRVLEAVPETSMRMPWLLLVTIGMLSRLLTVPLFVTGFIFVEYIFGRGVDYSSSALVTSLQDSFAFTALKIAVAGLFTSTISDFVKLPNIRESFCAFYFIFHDVFIMIREASHGK